MSDNAQPPSAQQNLIAGALSVAFGAFILAAASHYPMGTLLRMGPGFFPCIIAALIVLLGLGLFVSGLRMRRDAAALKVQCRSVLAIGAGVILFALLLERIGLVPATLLLVLVSSLADPAWRPRRVAVLAVIVTTLVYLLFIAVLQIPVPAVNL